MQAAPRPLPADGARQEENPGEPPGKRALNKKPLTGEVVCPDKLTSRRHEAPSQDKEEVQLKERLRIASSNHRPQPTAGQVAPTAGPMTQYMTSQLHTKDNTRVEKEAMHDAARRQNQG